MPQLGPSGTNLPTNTNVTLRRSNAPEGKELYEGGTLTRNGDAYVYRDADGNRVDRLYEAIATTDDTDLMVVSGVSEERFNQLQQRGGSYSLEEAKVQWHLSPTRTTSPSPA